jgi:hypothetical protein
LPYFVYRVFPFRRLEKVAEVPTFRDASVQAKALRVSPDRAADSMVKVVFAADENEAENLLSEFRAPKPGVADDE